MALPRIRRTEHLNDTSCHDDPSDSECSPYPAPVFPTPLPHPPPAPSSSPGSHGRGTFVTGLIIAGSALAFLILCLFLFLLVRRRRQRRRLRREALLQAAAATTTTNNDDDGPDPDLEEAGEEQGEVVHLVWHIRTEGLDQAAIESIALTRYRAGGVLGASDCAVCLGEFADGELMRLLPRCAHAFHVRCIDTWLRAHVNCPLCRARVLDPTVPAATAGTDADTGQAASRNTSTGHEQPDHQQANEQRELRLQSQIDRHDGRSTSPEQQPGRHTGPRGGNFRRVASMDSPSPIASAEEAALEADEQGTGGAVHCELLSPGSSGRPKNQRGMKRSLSVGSRWALVSRHGRRSGSLLPL